MTGLGLGLLLVLYSPTSALDNGLGRTPAMGYNTWNDFRCKGISAANVQKVADALLRSGLAAAGYRYVNIDDCWAVSRDAHSGELIPDPKAFPGGMAAVGEYLHRRGLRLGLYTDRGPLTCAFRPGSEGHEDTDARTFAKWGVDYLKEDSCFASSDHSVAFAQYATMRDALNRTGRPIYFSLCGWRDWYAPVGASLGNSWRVANDVDTFLDLYRTTMIMQSVVQYSRPGGWTDPDMLIGSDPRASVSLEPHQSRMQFSLWAVMAAPLLIGSNAIHLPPFDLETYGNLEVIAINQDLLGQPAAVVFSNCPRNATVAVVPPCQQIWVRRLVDSSIAMVMVNFAATNVAITCTASCIRRIGLRPSPIVRDVWRRKDLGRLPQVLQLVQANGGSALLRLWDHQ